MTCPNCNCQICIKQRENSIIGLIALSVGILVCVVILMNIIGVG